MRRPPRVAWAKMKHTECKFWLAEYLSLHSERLLLMTQTRYFPYDLPRSRLQKIQQPTFIKCMEPLLEIRINLHAGFVSYKTNGCISNCRDRMLNLGKNNTWLAKSFIMQGHNDHKGRHPR